MERLPNSRAGVEGCRVCHRPLGHKSHHRPHIMSEHREGVGHGFARQWEVQRSGVDVVGFREKHQCTGWNHADAG